MLHLDNTTEYSQRIFIPRPVSATGGSQHVVTLQDKKYTITENGLTIIRPDSGYDGLSGGTISVYVNGDTATTFEALTAAENGEYVATGNSAFSAVTVDVDLETPFEEGYTAGESDQKAKLTDLNVTANGEYNREDGYKKVVVNVPTGSTINNQEKSVTITANTATTITFDAGYTGLESVAINVNVTGGTASLTALTATTNGNYTPSAGYDGYSAVTVSVQTGSTINNQSKTVTISEDQGEGTNYISAHTVVNYDQGYTGLEDVTIDVAIPCINSQYMGTFRENGNYVISSESGKAFREAVIGIEVPTGSTASLTALTATTNGEYTAETGYDGFSAVTVDVQPVVTGLTATTNGTYNVPSGIDGYNTVKVNVTGTCPTTAVTVGLGITELPVPATSVTCYGASTAVTSWDEISAETAVTMDKWMMLDFVGREDPFDDYPSYSSYNKIPSVVNFEQQLPYVKNSLRSFLSNNTAIEHIRIYDLAVLGFEGDDIYLDMTNFCNGGWKPLEDVVIADRGLTSVMGRIPVNFSNAFQYSHLTAATITQKFGDAILSGMFSGCADLTYVNLGGGLAPLVAIDCLEIFSGCTSLETIEGFVGAIEYTTIDNSTNPFYDLPALVNFEGFESGLGADFYRDPTGTHTVDLSISTGLSHTSLVTLLNKLGTVDSSVTNAQLILGATNLAKLSAAEQAIATNKNWILQ